MYEKVYPKLALVQPRSQGLSSYRPSLAPGGGKMRDPGNEVGSSVIVRTHCSEMQEKVSEHWRQQN